jgi:hypothetical protein
MYLIIWIMFFLGKSEADSRVMKLNAEYKEGERETRLRYDVDGQRNSGKRSRTNRDRVRNKNKIIETNILAGGPLFDEADWDIPPGNKFYYAAAKLHEKNESEGKTVYVLLNEKIFYLKKIVKHNFLVVNIGHEF